jgi:hypothetical protein
MRHYDAYDKSLVVPAASIAVPVVSKGEGACAANLVSPAAIKNKFYSFCDPLLPEFHQML